MAYHFRKNEFWGIYDWNLKKFLDGKLGVCSKCGSRTVRVSRWWSETDVELCEVSCGHGLDCHHSIRGTNIELVLNEWNDESNDLRDCANVIVG